MEPIAAVTEDPSLSFDFPSPDELKPPLITLDLASVGYEPGKPILERLNLRIDPDERIALLGRNGNGKTTLARLLSAQLPPMEGSMSASRKMRVGYFTQYQVEELDSHDTPLEHMTREMKGAPPGKVRAQLGRFGFSGQKAETLVSKLSGGERARLALALITRDAPHMLILDEPTNHLDVDAREALVQALNAYEGAVVIVSHDRHMIELTSDRLVLVDGGEANEFAGSLDDYTKLILKPPEKANGKDTPKAPKRDKKQERRAAAAAREAQSTARKKLKSSESELAKLTARRSEIDSAMFDPATAKDEDAGRTISELSQYRGEIEKQIAEAEERWLKASEIIAG